MQSPWASKVLDFAIVNEERAAEFYRYLADNARWDHMRELLLGFAKEEEQHKARLLDIKAGAAELVGEERIADLGLTEQPDDVTIDLSGEMDPTETLAIVIRNEQAAYELYTKLADATGDAALKSILRGLAAQEAQHKLQFETAHGKRLEGKR